MRVGPLLKGSTVGCLDLYILGVCVYDYLPVCMYRELFFWTNGFQCRCHGYPGIITPAEQSRILRLALPSGGMVLRGVSCTCGGVAEPRSHQQRRVLISTLTAESTSKIRRHGKAPAVSRHGRRHWQTKRRKKMLPWAASIAYGHIGCFLPLVVLFVTGVACEWFAFV